MAASLISLLALFRPLVCYFALEILFIFMSLQHRYINGCLLLSLMLCDVMWCGAPNVEDPCGACTANLYIFSLSLSRGWCVFGCGCGFGCGWKGGAWPHSFHDKSCETVQMFCKSKYTQRLYLFCSVALLVHWILEKCKCLEEGGLPSTTAKDCRSQIVI